MSGSLYRQGRTSKALLAQDVIYTRDTCQHRQGCPKYRGGRGGEGGGATGAVPAKRCLGEGMEMQHRMAEAFLTASSRKGDSAAALTASEARCISDWPGPICTRVVKGN